MKLIKLEFRNIGKYGNQLQTLNFHEAGSLNLISGRNGNGKCVSPDTEINIKFKDSKTQRLFEEFLKK